MIFSPINLIAAWPNHLYSRVFTVIVLDVSPLCFNIVDNVFYFFKIPFDRVIFFTKITVTHIKREKEIMNSYNKVTNNMHIAIIFADRFQNSASSQFTSQVA